MKRSSPPKSARVLSQWVDQYARSMGQAPGRVRSWVSFMVLAGALERAGFSQAGSPRFTVKGGVALRYLGRGWDTVPVDVSRREGTRVDVELVQVSLLGEFGIRSPESIPCLSLPFHVAQKIHAMTEPHSEERPNHRFRDLVDLLLLRQWITDLQPLKAACQTVFSHRETHPWPPLVQAHDPWIEPFGYLAESVGLPTRDIHQAVREAQAFLHEVDTVSLSS